MNLSRFTLKNINPELVSVPDESIFDLPEKVLQFGTGVLLRGLPDHFIDKANRQGSFNGRIVVVKSTGQGDTAAFERQDGLYTVCMRGIRNGEHVDEKVINASISRVLSATEEWEQVLECAHNQQLQVVVSNTTEVGIQMVQDDVRHHPPKSFPGKLLAFLYERFKAFGGSAHSGLVIIPTELIPDNGRKLEAIVLELAHLNGLEEAFIEWVENCNSFCSSLVDRIVPGRPEPALGAQLEKELGYTDALLTVSEVYSLWAIEGDEKVRAIASFADADPGVIIEPDIDRYRELKLRLLNGTHTLSCGVAFLAGCETVKQAMDDDTVASFITELMMQELAPAIPYAVSADEAHAFGAMVLDRFRNPHIRHAWINITMQYSSKMKMRCMPLLLEHYRRQASVPELLAFGFAAYLYFMKAVTRRDGKYYGDLDGQSYLVQDDQAEVFYKRWLGLSIPALVKEVLNDTAFWEADLHALPGFEKAVVEYLNRFCENGVRETLETQTKKEAAA